LASVKLHFSEKSLIFFTKITPEYQHFYNKIKDFSKKNAILRLTGGATPAIL
jgi:hypothetical protein